MVLSEPKASYNKKIIIKNVFFVFDLKKSLKIFGLRFSFNTQLTPYSNVWLNCKYTFDLFSILKYFNFLKDSMKNFELIDMTTSNLEKYKCKIPISLDQDEPKVKFKNFFMQKSFFRIKF